MSGRSFRRTRKRLLSLLLCFAMASSLLVTTAAAKGPEDAVAPVYNAAEDVYEISTPAQLMYLSGTWKEGAPRDGNYVLTADIDMAGWEGFRPIASEKEEGYLGTFDGRYHVIRNLTIDYPKKYVGLFGYVGNENDQAYVKNVAMLDCEIRGQQNVGGIAGVTYGTITGCVVTGHVWVDDLSNSHTSGGIAGKVKEGEGPIIGHVENCYVNANVEAPYDVGGIAGIQDGGGFVGNSLAAGTVNAYGENGSAGGIAGSFNAGDRIIGCVSAQTSISGTRNVDKIVGQLDDEAATNISGNIAWEGTLLAGNEPAFQPIQWEDVSADALHQKQTYVDLGWDFNNAWTWSDSLRQPILKGYDPAIFAAVDFTADGPRIISRAVNDVDQNAKTAVTARVAGASSVTSAVLHYGYAADDLSQELPMTISGTTCTADLPSDKAGDLFYYLEIQADGQTLTKPYDKTAPIQVFVDDGSILGEPSQITMTPDTTQGNLRFSWITVPEVTASVIQYKKQGESSWKTVRGTSYVDAVTPGWKELATHQAVLKDLEPDAMYVYRVGDGGQFMSEEHTFKAPTSPDADEFSFIFVSDPQSVSTDDYMSFKKSLDYATTLVTPEFIMSGGDTTQDGYKATEWEACFEVMGDYYAAIPTITVPGNHEMKGDWGFVSFAQRFNMPGGDSGTEFDNTIGCIEYSSKDALFLLCVERTFAELKDYVEQHAELLDGQDTLNDIREYFLIREHFFQQNPREKMIFETAMLRPPKLLAEQIHQLRAPIRSMNREFLRRLVGKMPLRPGLDQEKATRYLESVGYFFQNVASCYYQSGKTGTDLHAVLEQAGEMLDLFLFGVLRQPGCPADPLQPGDGPDPAGSGGAA